MRRSRTITLTVLAGLLLTGCCIGSPGCGRRSASADHTWYDASGNRIEERWKLDEHGNKVLDAQGRPIPEPGVPYDRYHRPWVFAGGMWAPLPPPGGYSSTRSRTGGSWLWGGSGYRSGSSGSSFRSGSSGSSISRGGFGSTGSGGG